MGVVAERAGSSFFVCGLQLADPQVIRAAKSAGTPAASSPALF